MAPTIPVRKGKAPKSNTESRSVKRKRDQEDIASLNKSVEDLDTSADFDTFTSLPLSKSTSLGLSASHFKTLTTIQSKAIPLALKGLDVLGAAQTGSGKTLAFLVPVLENLYRSRWTELDGLGALVISPTRELAIQTFEVLRKIGRYHTFSAGLVIGGKSLEEERVRLSRMNILICTPGRILQHLDQTASFDSSHLQMLVLDEADRIMDMGFTSTLDAIIQHLPSTRQTLLFSATQTKRVSDLARLSLQAPEYISVHSSAKSATPTTLQQHYLLTPLPEKLSILYSFIRANVKSKILVFLSSGKQVRFVYESFRRMQPGIPLLHLHGRQKQTARLDITTRFSSSSASCLLATDVVARGLDFPAVDWVVQVDCPEDAETYIHRVGRTARYERTGRAVLLLDPNEEHAFLARLQAKRVPIERINAREKKREDVSGIMQNMCFKDVELKYLGQKAFVSYVRSVWVQADKEVFDVRKLDLEAFAASLGLPGAPKIRFVKGDDAKQIKNAPRERVESGSEEEEGTGARKKGEVRTKYDRMFERRNQDVLADHYAKIKDGGLDEEDEEVKDDGMGDADEDDDFLTVKRRLDMSTMSLGSDDSDVGEGGIKKKVIPGLNGGEGLIIDSKRREKMLKSKKKLLKLKGKGTKLVYDSDGEAHQVYELEDEQAFKRKGDAETQRQRFLDKEGQKVKAADLTDKQLAKEKKRVKVQKKKDREAALAEESEEDDGATVAEPVSFEEGDRPLGDLQTDDGESRPEKRARKWFEDEDEAEMKIGGKRIKRGLEPLVHGKVETLEDLEALASGLLAP